MPLDHPVTSIVSIPMATRFFHLPSAAAFIMASMIFSGISGCTWIERKLLFYPTHLAHTNGLTPWKKAGETIGYCRRIETPKNVWLMLHGNGGQASDRVYALPSFSNEDSVFILEYPGYGRRSGVPSRASFDRAAEEAYRCLRADYPNHPVCVAAESIGSGPAAFLTSLNVKPDKVVLIVPFDRLSLVAADHFPAFLIKLFLSTDWDNAAMLSDFNGPVDVFGAKEDTIIPVAHAKTLAAAIPEAKLMLIDGGHNDWSIGNRVKIKNP